MRNQNLSEDQTQEGRTPHAQRFAQQYLEEWSHQGPKMTAVDRLAGGIVHDFNNLLTAIMGHCDILLREPLPDGLVRESVRQILRGGERGALLTRQFSALVRNQASELRTLDLRAVVEETKSMLGRLLGANVTLEIILDPNLGCVRADPGKIEQVLVNLLMNASAAMPAGGRITLEVSNASPQEGRAPGGIPPHPYVMLAVTDTGCGMAEEVLTEAFRLPRFTTGEHGKGTGLGLYTVRQIVRQSGGFLTVSSELGQGTRFEVYLPRVEEAALTEVPAGPSPWGSETVLTDEDETGTRNAIYRTLRQDGYTILGAGDDADAMTVL